MFSCEYCQIFKNTYFEELRTAASVSWLGLVKSIVGFSSKKHLSHEFTQSIKQDARSQFASRGLKSDKFHAYHFKRDHSQFSADNDTWKW